jgi:hypothetical protein
MAANKAKQVQNLAAIAAKERRCEAEIEEFRNRHEPEEEAVEHEEHEEEEEELTEAQRARRRRDAFERTLDQARAEKVEADRVAAMMEREEERRREIQAASDKRHASRPGGPATKGSKGQKPAVAVGRKRKS